MTALTSRWLRLAARNLLRHRRRTLLTGSIVVVGFVALTMTGGFVGQTFNSLRKAYIQTLGGHLRLFDPRAAGKTDDEAASLLMPKWEELRDAVKDDPEVVQAMPKLQFFGLVTKGDRSAAYLGTGTIPDLERRASLTAESVSKGTFLKDPEAAQVMLGSGLSRALGAGIGDLVTVMTTTPEGALNAVDAEVVAVLVYPIKEVDDRLLYMPYAAAAKLLASEGMASHVVVLLADGVDLEAAATRIAARLRSANRVVVVKTWLETAAFYKQVRLLYAAIFLFLGIVLAIVIILATANTMMMSVFERTREIGMLLAIGMDRTQVRWLFVHEGMLLAIFGTLVGIVFSLLLRAILNAIGIQMPPPPGGTRGNVLHVEFIPLAYVIAFAVMSATLLLASLGPARRAAKLDPVEALTHV